MGTVGMILYWLGAIAMLVFWIQILIIAFKKSVGWGIGSLLIPIVGLVFVFMNWADCKTPFLRYVVALVVFAIGASLWGWGAFSAGMQSPPAM